jgi:hypothetical protein
LRTKNRSARESGAVGIAKLEGDLFGLSTAVETSEESRIVSRQQAFGEGSLGAASFDIMTALVGRNRGTAMP